MVLDKLIGLGGLAINGLGTAFGAYQSAKYGNESRRVLKEGNSALQSWYNGKLAEDYTSRSDFQSIFNKQRDLLNEQYKRAKGAVNVVGGTDESLAMHKASNALANAQIMGNVASNASAYKDNIDNARMQAQANYNQQVAQSLVGQGQAMAQAGSMVGRAGGELASSADWSWLMKRNR